MTIQIRNYTSADLTVLVNMLNDAGKDSYEFSPDNESQLTSWIEESGIQILLAEENGEILGSVAYREKGHWGEQIEWLTVPERRNRTLIENMLTDGIEQYVKCGAVHTLVDEGSPKADDWIERGYHVDGGLYHLVAELNAAKPLPTVPQSIALRSLRPSEENAFVEAVNAGFGWERLKAGIIHQWKTECPSFDEGWVHVAEADSKIVSVVASREDAYFHERFGDRRGYLGPATTLPGFRGMGIASALTQRAMNVLLEKGLRRVVLYTSEHNASSVALLRNLGFGVGHHWLFMRKKLTPKTSVESEDSGNNKHEIC